MRKFILGFVVMAVTLSFTSSCAPIKTKGVVKVEKPKVRVAEPGSVELMIQKEEYLSALKLIRKERKREKKEDMYSHEYVRALNGLLYRGKLLYFKKEFERGARTFREVLTYYPGEPGEVKMVSESSGNVRKLVDEGSENLMEEGLGEYRNGNLGYAIKIWKKILIFNPGYKEAKKAIDTATIQLKNLKFLKKGEK